MLTHFLPIFLAHISLYVGDTVATSTVNDITAGYANTSAITPISGVFSQLRSFNSLVARQSCGGGVMCDANSCCAAGLQCCPTDCCPSSGSCCGPGCCSSNENCLNNSGCCPKNGQVCGNKCCQPGTVCCANSPTGCCVSGGSCCSNSQSNPCCPPGMSCCGNTCCAQNEICELDECVPKDLVTSGKIVRFKLDPKKNQRLLRNMCNGMRGKNTETLTYSGPISESAKATKRRLAGCVKGFCADQIRQGQVPSNFNSCDEYPPASTDEGGNSRAPNLRAINCIPGPENSFQGGVLGGKLGGLFRAGRIQAGDSFVISIDCSKVLNSINQPRDIEESVDRLRRNVTIRSQDTISMSGTTHFNETFTLDNDTSTYFVASFGDLNPGQYVAKANIISGSTTNAIVIANEGDNYTAALPGSMAGQSQQFTFNLGFDDVGLGIIFASNDNNTVINWTLDGTLSPTSTSTITTTSTPTSTARSSATSGLPRVSLPFLISIVTLICALL